MEKQLQKKSITESDRSKSDLKSNNLQCNTLVCWAHVTNDSSTKRLMFQALFFIISHRLRAFKTLYSYFEATLVRPGENYRRVLRNHKKNNAWNIRRLVNESFVPPSQQTSILYCRLSDFKSNNKLLLKLHVDITQSSSNSLTQPASFLFALTYCQILR